MEKINSGKDADEQSNSCKDPALEENKAESSNGSSDDLFDNIDNERLVLEVQKETVA